MRRLQNADGNIIFECYYSHLLHDSFLRWCAQHIQLFYSPAQNNFITLPSVGCIYYKIIFLTMSLCNLKLYEILYISLRLFMSCSPLEIEGVTFTVLLQNVQKKSDAIFLKIFTYDVSCISLQVMSGIVILLNPPAFNFSFLQH